MRHGEVKNSMIKGSGVVCYENLGKNKINLNIWEIKKKGRKQWIVYFNNEI